MRDDPALRFELCLGVTGVHYPARDRARAARGLPPAVDHPQPAGPARGRRAPTATRTSRRPSRSTRRNDWHERETFDFFGIVFDGHPGLTRIQMPDDWPGHPQRKDYPLGGIPVEYKGAEIPPPDERRSLLSDRDHERSTTLRRPRETTEGTVYTVTGGDWDTVVGRARRVRHDERIVVNMGPQHPSTHGVLRLILELEGETVTECRARHRLPAHRHREEPRVPHLDPGRHVRDPDGLPRAVLQRDGVLPGGREAARHRPTRSPSGPTSSG